MIHTPIQETPVMGHQNKSLPFSQILRYNLSAMCIQMIGRLIDQQKMSFIQKQCCKKDFRLFSVGKRLKRTPKHFFIHFQSVKFLPYLPLFCLRTHLIQDFHRPLFCIFYRIRKIIKPNGFYNFPPILIPIHQKI